MRFLADMGVAGGVVEWLRANEHDAVHLRERGLARLPDEQVLELAFAESRILLTFDLDFGEMCSRELSSLLRTSGTASGSCHLASAE